MTMIRAANSIGTGSRNWRGLGLGSAMALVLALGACDRQSERVERAGEIYDGARRQIAEEVLGVEAARSALEAASPEGRAVAGRILSADEVLVSVASQESLFAVGAIVAKPIQLEEPMLAMAPAEPVVEEDASGLPVLAVDEAVAAEIAASIGEMPDEAAAGDNPDGLESAPAVTGRVRGLERLRTIELPEVEEIAAIETQEIEPLRKLGRVRTILKRDDGVEKGGDETAGDTPEEGTKPVRPVVGARPALPPLDPDVIREGALKRVEVAQEVRDLLSDETVAMAPALPPEEFFAQQRMAMRAQRMEVQQVAQSRMLDAMEEFGLSGTPMADASGVMVLQIGEDAVDPTQFTPERAPLRPDLPRFAKATREVDWGRDCESSGAKAAMKADQVLATNCMVLALEQTGEFEYVEKDFIFVQQFARKPKPTPPLGAVVMPNDPLVAKQWHLRPNGSGEGKSPGGSGFLDFWKTQGTQGSREVVVAVVDTGLQMSHPDINGSANLIQGYDFVSDPRMGNDGDGRDPDPNDPGDRCDLEDPFDQDSFHGTHVAGLVGAASTNNGKGIAGGAWNVSVVPVRAMGRCGGRLSDINEAIRWSAGIVPVVEADGTERWVEKPADIINLSLGLFERCPASLQDAIDTVTASGVIVVAAAGNARISTEFYAPGGCNNVISVAASDQRGVIAPYSNYGANVTLIAPGGDLTRDDDADGLPDGVLSTKLASNCTDPVTGAAMATCQYAYEQGTSMAAPNVSAALALLKARHPAKLPGELVDMLIAAVEPRTDLQCAGACTSYPGATPIPGQAGQCARPCGAGLLNLSRIGQAPGQPG